jgi:type IV pilus assembly protein PilV
MIAFHSLLRRRTAGFSMVEALVALVVLGVGMLGIASLYVVTLRAGGSAVSRTQAVNLASDMADRIRANPNAKTAYEAEGADNECVGANKGCTPEALAAHDLGIWEKQIAALLPAGATGVIEYTAAAAGVPSTYTVTVSWTEPGSDETLQYTTDVQI